MGADSRSLNANRAVVPSPLRRTTSASPARSVNHTRAVPTRAGATSPPHASPPHRMRGTAAHHTGTVHHVTRSPRSVNPSSSVTHQPTGPRDRTVVH